MKSQDIKVFDVEECIKNFRKTYKVPKKKKETIVNYIFNVYLVLKNNKTSQDGNIDINDITTSGKKNNNDTIVQQNISIQLDSNGLNQLLSYINMIPEKYKLETKRKTSRSKSITTTNTDNTLASANTIIADNTLAITNNVNSGEILQIENTQYPLLTYQKNKNNEKTNKNTIVKINTPKAKRPQCMGRTAKHTRCSRSCKKGFEYCQSHINNKCPFGRFDEKLKEPEQKVVKKRGRKRKVEISEKFKNKNYITMWPEIVEGDKCLVDRYNNIYTFDIESPKFIGVKQLNGVIDKTASPLTSVF